MKNSLRQIPKTAETAHTEEMTEEMTEEKEEKIEEKVAPEIEILEKIPEVTQIEDQTLRIDQDKRTEDKIIDKKIEAQIEGQLDLHTTSLIKKNTHKPLLDTEHTSAQEN
jgi:hypothetical protein